jgi:hypothetical protein
MAVALSLLALWLPLAAVAQGHVRAWGANDYGQLGSAVNSGTGNPDPAPVQVSGLTDVVEMAGGGFHSLALKSDGTLWAWGDNGLGQLGDRTHDSGAHPTPAQVSGLAGMAMVAAGSTHSLALTAQLSGRLALDGLVPGARAQTLAFTFRPHDGNGALPFTLLVGPDGLFFFDGLPEKDYTLHIQGARYLAANVEVDLTRGEVSGLSTTLHPGDINGDNTVGIQDLGLLADAFNTTPASPKWNANADLNGEGNVNIADLGLLADSFGQSGDP